MTRAALRAPFPWFGGKSLAAPLLWRAFGNVPNYVEPFAGSLATLLARPHAAKVETVNDKDGLICNFWRATQYAPAEVARWCDWPVNEADLHARHRWLVARALPLTERLIAHPDFFDAKVAGWWVWGVSMWIGGGWCSREHGMHRGRPDLSYPRGVHAKGRRRPELATANGRGVLALHRSMPAVGKPGTGIHSPQRRKPHTNRPNGVQCVDGSELANVFARLADRMRNVRVLCGDWTRVLGPSTLGIDTNHGMTPCAVLLDPPYDHDLRSKRIYNEDDSSISAATRTWAIEHGEHPDLRIALCGFEGEHEMPRSWRCVAWASTSSAKSRAKERIWFSPHCLDVDHHQGELALGAVA